MSSQEFKRLDLANRRFTWRPSQIRFIISDSPSSTWVPPQVNAEQAIRRLGRCAAKHICSRQPWVSARAAFLTGLVDPFHRHGIAPAGCSFAHSSLHSGTASTIAGGPAVNVSERPIRRRFRGSLPPRTQAHFVFVRSVELNEQTTRPSRTVWCSGASPAFGVPQSPLRAGLLVHTSFSAHFQDCQALQALASSCSSPCPHGQLHAFALG